MFISFIGMLSEISLLVSLKGLGCCLTYFFFKFYSSLITVSVQICNYLLIMPLKKKKKAKFNSEMYSVVLLGLVLLITHCGQHILYQRRTFRIIVISSKILFNCSVWIFSLLLGCYQ